MAQISICVSHMISPSFAFSCPQQTLRIHQSAAFRFDWLSLKISISSLCINLHPSSCIPSQTFPTLERRAQSLPSSTTTMPFAAFIPHALPHAIPSRHASGKLSKIPTCSLRVNPVPATAYAAYMSHLFLFPPTPSVPSEALAEATNLSVNFAYLIPTFFPYLTSPNHPMLEAIFHIVVAWALLLLAFVSDSASQTEKTIPAAPFLIAAAFLTNIFYLPYLAIRKTRPPPFSKLEKTPLLNFAESQALPIGCVVLLLTSLFWGALARPEFGDLATRFQSFRAVVENDILAYSFVVDTLVFSLFQAWMVSDDAGRRKWADDGLRDRLLSVSRLPFVGLAAYLFVRARNAPLQWVDEP